MKKWSCSKCGFSTGRKWVIERHIRNPNLHDGNAELLGHEEYIAGVRSSKYPAPTYAYITPYRRLLKHSRITLTDITIAIPALLEKSWQKKFSNIFKGIVQDAAKSSSTNPALEKSKDRSLVAICYYGYICSKCFSMGVTYDAEAAKAINEGDHICSPPFSKHSPLAPGKEANILENLQNDRADLLFEVVKALTGDKRLVLLGRTDYPNYSNFYWSAQLLTAGLVGSLMFSAGRLVLDDSKLEEYLHAYPNTRNSIDIQYENHRFKYDTWLAIEM